MNPSDQFATMQKNSSQPKKSFFRRFWWVGIIIVILALAGILIKPILKDKNTNSEDKKNTDQSETKASADKSKDDQKIYFPACPKNVAGVLISPFFETKYIKAIRPLGDVNPPGHTTPVDHTTFMTDYKGKIPIYAPADGWITRVEKVSWLKNSQYVPVGFRIYQTVCQGLEISAGGYKEFVFESELKDGECQEGINKGKEGTSSKCDYKFNKKLKAGDLIGYTALDENGTIPFEWWAVNQNQAPRTDVNWDYYKTDSSKDAMCLFDLYDGALKADYYKYFGHFDTQTGFVPRTIQPVCGEINQNKVGTIQGMWFSGAPYDNIEMDGKGIAFVHNAFDPSLIMLSIGGNIADNRHNIVYLKPKSPGTIDRDPADIPADNKIYCYDTANATNHSEWDGKILVQLVDNTHLKVERKTGACSTNETLSNPFNFER